MFAMNGVSLLQKIPTNESKQTNHKTNGKQNMYFAQNRKIVFYIQGWKMWSTTSLTELCIRPEHSAHFCQLVAEQTMSTGWIGTRLINLLSGPRLPANVQKGGMELYCTLFSLVQCMQHSLYQASHSYIQPLHRFYPVGWKLPPKNQVKITDN